MTEKFELDGIEYKISEISSVARSKLKLLDFTHRKLLELENMVALLTRAKRSYIESLKAEMFAGKAGFIVDDE